MERTLREECDLVPGVGILLAVSGGSDSMALLHVLTCLAPKLTLRLAACGVDHGLRAAATAELDLAEQFCSARGVPFFREGIQLAAGGNLQARARDGRYQALERVREHLSFEYLATAHHAQDRAETVLLRLLRGAGPSGLSVLPARDGHRLRPMIRAPKAAVLVHLQQHGIPSAEDPSNVDPRFLRTRVRTELLPLLQELSPGIVGHLTTLADELAEPPLPPVLDEKGELIRLNRAQRQELRNALRDHNPRMCVLISGGRVIRLDPRTGQPRLCSVESGRPAADDSVSTSANLPSRPFKNPTTG